MSPTVVKHSLLLKVLVYTTSMYIRPSLQLTYVIKACKELFSVIPACPTSFAIQNIHESSSGNISSLMIMFIVHQVVL